MANLMADLMVVNWIGSAVIGMLVKKIEDLMSEPGMTKQLEMLKSELLVFQYALMVAEKKNTHNNPALESWIWKLRDVVEEVEDVLDDIEYNRIKRQVTANRAADNKVSTSFSSTKKKLEKFSKFVELPKKCHMLKRIREVRQKLDAVKTEAKDVVDIFNVATALASDNLPSENFHDTNYRETGHIPIADEVFGRDKAQKEISEWLMQTDSSKKILAKIICGMGGLGKTTLCQAIFDDQTIKDHFQLSIWICVSNQFDAIRLLTKAIEFIEGSVPASTTLSMLQQKLLNILIGKKFLLVLDDVWDDADLTSWENFVTPLKHGDGVGKILITTREASISKMVAQSLLIEEDLYNLTVLDEDDCTSLFNKHAFAGVNPDDHKNLQNIGKKIIEKCGGLPLVLKHMGGLLRTNLDYRYWVKIWENDILQLKNGTKDVLEVLKISYKHLSPNLQACFRFCSIYPQDYRFSNRDFRPSNVIIWSSRNELVHMWAGAGLIQQSIKDTRLIEEIGEEYLDSLQTRSFFEVQYWRDGMKFYIMHDLVHELAQVVSEGECLAVTGDKFDHIPGSLRHLSITKPNEDVLNHLQNLQKLRTLHIDCTRMSDKRIDVLSKVLMQLKRLRILCLLSLPKMAVLDSLGNLKHLRHLAYNIKNCKNWSPISTMYTLYLLQFFSFSCNCWSKNCSVDGINVEGVSNFVKLRYLDIPSSIMKRVNQIQHVTELRGIRCFVGAESDFKLSNLKHLNKLCTLEICGLENLTSPEEAAEVNFGAKEYLQDLSFIWKDDKPQQDPEFHEQILELMRPHSHSQIKKFILRNYEGRIAPNWMTTSQFLSSIVHLTLSGCNNLEHLPPLSYLSSLKFLNLSELSAIKQIAADFDGSFPSLEELALSKMENLEEWTGAENMNLFTHLKKLEIEDCMKMKALPPLPLCLTDLHLGDVGLTALPQWQDMNINRGPALEKLELGNFPSETFLQCVQLFSTCASLRTLRLQGNTSLTSLDGLNVLASIRDLSIEGCSSLTSLSGLHGFTSLNFLSIKGCNNLVGAAAMHMADEVASTSQPQTISSFPRQQLYIDDVELLQLEPLRHIKSANLLIIYNDNKMESLAMAEQWLQLNTTSLKTFILDSTNKLRFLPPKFQCLFSSLKDLYINNCPLLESLPEMPSSLKTLKIHECPLLMKRYDKEGGPDWHQISHIDDVDFD